MEATTTFETETKLIALDDKRCVVGRPQKNVTCTVINSCLRYKGVNLPTFVGTSNFIKEFLNLVFEGNLYCVFFRYRRVMGIGRKKIPFATHVLFGRGRP